MKELTFITGSEKKFKEAISIIPFLKQLDIDLPEIQESDPKAVIAAKLQEARKHHSEEYIVEDTSVYFECLNGLPGPFIKWFMKTLGLSGLATLAEKMGNTKATAKTIVGYMDSSGNIEYFEGSVEGNIVHPQGPENFGWDPIFKPLGESKTFAEMSPEEKAGYSMRAIALNKLFDYIKQQV